MNVLRPTLNRKSTMTTFILPIDTLAREMEAFLMAFLDEFGGSLEELEHPPHDDDYLELVYTLVDDELNQRMRWTSRGYHAQTVLDKRFPDFIFRLDEERRDAFECDVIEPVRSTLLGALDVVIPSTTWDIWYTKRLGRDIVLEKGEDYRIMDWTKRYRKGEFTLHD